jgi:hypothetical protein
MDAEDPRMAFESDEVMDVFEPPAWFGPGMGANSR